MTQTNEAIRDAYRPARRGFIATLRDTAGEISTRRRLILYLVRADLKKRGADTVLGNLWWVIDPLLTMLVYVVLISIVLNVDIDAYPLFIFAAILPWKWFSSSIADAVTCITTRERVIKQVAFPKIVLPMSVAVGGVASFVFGLVPLVAMLVFLYPNHLSGWILLLPVIAAVQFVFTAGVAVLASALTVFYRDIGNVATHVLRLWFYLSPALYDAERATKHLQGQPILLTVYNLNPFVALFGSYRNVIYSGSPPAWDLLALVLAESFVLIVVAVLIFRRLEPAFAKVI
jgi:homopolymeric O-antigen transport system permease protein